MRANDTEENSIIADYGSCLWRAPELMGGDMSEPADVYAYGFLIMQISTRCDIPADEVLILKYLAY